MGTWPARLEAVQCYTVYLQEQGLVPRTIHGQLVAIAFFNKVHGFPDPCTILAHKAIEGWKSYTPKVPDSHRPITFEKLARLTDCLPRVCRAHYKTMMFLATFTLAFWGPSGSGSWWPIQEQGTPTTHRVFMTFRWGGQESCSTSGDLRPITGLAGLSCS